MSGWERTHRRYRLVYAVAEDIARRGPSAVDTWQSMIDGEYGGTERFLLDVRRRWLNAVDAYSDYVATPVAEASRNNSRLRVLLDAFAEHPVVSGLPAPLVARAESA